MSEIVERMERGFPGHFCGAADCYFRRQTLLRAGERRIVVSTVGAYYPERDGTAKPIGGAGQFYETLVFPATRVAEDRGYVWIADHSNGPLPTPDALQWSLPIKPSAAADLCADAMHDAMVEHWTETLEDEFTPTVLTKRSVVAVYSELMGWEKATIQQVFDHFERCERPQQQRLLDGLAAVGAELIDPERLMELVSYGNTTPKGE